MKPNEVKTGPIIVWCVIVLTVAVIWLILGRVQDRPMVRSKAYLAACRSNLLQIGLRLNLYRDDYNGRLPPSLDLAEHYIANTKPLRCPSSEKLMKESTYSYRPRQNPTSEDMLCWDSVPHEFNANRDGLIPSPQRNVLFGDFRVEAMDEPDFEKLYAKQTGQ